MLIGGLTFVFDWILIQPILVALKCDNTLGEDAPWVAIWAPMWLFDIFLLLSALYVLFHCDKKRRDDEEEDQEHHKHEVSFLYRLYQYLIALSFIVLQVFVMIRLDKYVSWPWFGVFIPWFVHEGLVFFYHIHGAFFKPLTPPANTPFHVEEGKDETEEEQKMKKLKEYMEYFQQELEQDRCRKVLVNFFLRVWQAIFLALQLDHWVQWNWGLGFLPMWLFFFMQVVSWISYGHWGRSKFMGLQSDRLEAQDPSEVAKIQQFHILKGKADISLRSMLVLLFMGIMLVCRLQLREYSTFLILLPFWIFMGIIGCTLCCVLTCLSALNPDLEDDGIVIDTNEAQVRGQVDAAQTADVDVEGGSGHEMDVRATEEATTEV